MSLASNHLCTRQAGHFILSTAYSLIDGSTFKGRNQIMLLLNYFRNSMPVEDPNELKALPSLITSFVAQSLMILLKSESDMYPVFNTFILQRPLLDLEDIPLFYSLFYSKAQDSKSERIWMLRLLKNGLNDVIDFQVFQRRHVFEILLTFYTSAFSDYQTRKLISEILFKASTIPSVISSLVTKYGLISFFKTQIFGLQNVTEVGSLKILAKRCLEGFKGTPQEWDGPINRNEWITQFEIMKLPESDCFDIDSLYNSQVIKKRKCEEVEDASRNAKRAESAHGSY
jgi:hypothetical protein